MYIFFYLLSAHQFDNETLNHDIVCFLHVGLAGEINQCAILIEAKQVNHCIKHLMIHHSLILV